MRIDPSRLSRLLLALGQKADNVRQGGISKQTSIDVTGAKTATRDIKVLRKELRARLRALDSEADSFTETASTITIQQILCWEFGQEIIDHPDFQRIAASITQTMLKDEKMAASMKKLAQELAQAD